MKKVVFIGIIIVAVILAKVFLFSSKKESPNLVPQNQNQSHVQNKSMILSSPSFNNNAKIPSKFTCDGGNINPEIQIHNVPPETKSLAIIMDDPDAPSGNFTHWLVWNIDPKTEIIKQESVPPGSTEGPNGTGKIGYTGPCPPDKKTHHYFIKLYALKDLIIETENIRNKADLENIFNKFLIEKAELIGTYLRTN